MSGSVYGSSGAQRSGRPGTGRGGLLGLALLPGEAAVALRPGPGVAAGASVLARGRSDPSELGGGGTPGLLLPTGVSG